MLGRGFYQVEFVNKLNPAKVLAMSPLAIQGTRVLFTPWVHGFDPTKEVARERLLLITICLFGLHKEYLLLLHKIGALLGSILEREKTVTFVVAWVAGMPSVGIFVWDPAALPKVIFLPCLGGGFFPQRVEYLRLPN